MQTVKFVVLCGPRSGSTYLCDCLNSHPDVYCHSELFHKGFEGDHHELMHFHSPGQDKDPISYLYHIYEYTESIEEVKAVGFKMIFRQNVHAMQKILEDQRIRIVFLQRRDKLAQWGSFALANSTGKWVRRHRDADGTESGNARVRFCYFPFLFFLREQLRWERQLRKRRNGPLCIWYEDITVQGGLDPVVDFLGVSRKVRLQASTMKQFAGQKTIDRFTNPTWAVLGSRLAIILARLARGIEVKSHSFQGN